MTQNFELIFEKLFTKKKVFDKIDFSIWTAGEGEAISLTPLYHFHQLHRHLVVSRAITAETSPLHIARNREPLVFEHRSVTPKVRALKLS